MLSALALLAIVAFAPQEPARPIETGIFSGAVPLDGNNEVFVTVHLEDTKVESANTFRMKCENKCRGNVHLIHSQCDASCDSVCEMTHSIVCDYLFYVFGNPTETRAFHDGIATFGSNTDAVEAALRILNSCTDKILPNKENLAITYNNEHFNPDPCSYRGAGPVLREYKAIANWRMRRTTMVDGKPVYTFGPTGTLHLATFFIPQRRVVITEAQISCGCNLVEEHAYGGPNETGTNLTGTVIPGDPFADAPAVPAISSPIRVAPKNPMLFPEGGTKQLTFGGVCEDMNSGQLTCDNPFETELACTLNPGCTLDTDADNVQDVVITRKYECTIAATGEVVPRGPSVGDQDPKAGFRLLCLEMNKREPDPKIKYRLLRFSDPVLSRLVQLPAPRFGGALPQARVWVYTDGGTYEQISKKLMFPKLQLKDYLIAVHDAYISGANLTGKKYAGCFDPATLAGIADRRSALMWYANELIRRDPKKLLQWAQKKDIFAEAIAANTKGETYAHIARLTGILASSDSADAQNSALAILKNMSDSAREKLAKEELGASYALVLSRHSQVAKLAQDVSKMYK